VAAKLRKILATLSRSGNGPEMRGGISRGLQMSPFFSDSSAFPLAQSAAGTWGCIRVDDKNKKVMAGIMFKDPAPDPPQAQQFGSVVFSFKHYAYTQAR